MGSGSAIPTRIDIRSTRFREPPKATFAVHGGSRQGARAGKRLANDARVSLWVGFSHQEGPGAMGQTIYVANSGNNSITEYAAKAGGKRVANQHYRWLHYGPQGP